MQKPIAACRQGVMAGRADEREPALLGRRSIATPAARSAASKVVSGGDRVAVEPGRLVHGPDVGDVLGRVAALHVGGRRRAGLVPLVDRVQQHLEPAGRVRMVPGRVQPNELGMGDDLDRSAARAATRSATWFMPQLLRREDASAHRGD